MARKRHRGYLASDELEPGLVGTMYAEAADLFDMAPWQWLGSHHLLRLDVPALGVVNACVSISGRVGVAKGLMILPSAAAFDAIVDTPVGLGPPELGGDGICLEYVRRSRFPAALLREATAHEWPVAAAAAYPLIEGFDHHCLLRPPTALEVMRMTACVSALTCMMAFHDEEIAAGMNDPIIVRYMASLEIEVQLTWPHDLAGTDEVAGEPSTGPETTLH